MSTLKDKLENYSKQPDEKVWQSIMETMNSRVSTVRRRRIVLSASAVAVASVALLFALNRGKDEPVAQQTKTAQVENVKTASVAMPETMTVEENVVTAADVVSRNESVKKSNADETTESNAAQAVYSGDVAPKESAAKSSALVVKEEPSTSNTASQPVAVSESKVETKGQEATEGVQNVAPQQKITTPKVPEQELVVWIPNAFSPDDQLNESVRQFKVYPNSEANLLSYEIFIYSRGGRQVYHSKDVSQGWDGTYNGHKQPMGTYVYIIELNDANKGLQHKKGTITLIR